MSITGIDLSTGADALGVLTFRGPDAARFLQGQLSAEVEKLGDGSSSLAGLHNPQGRVIALLALGRTSPEEVRAILPRELIEPVAMRLRKYVLRAKVSIEQDSSHRVIGTNAATATQPTIVWGDRRLVVMEMSADIDGAITREQWERLDVEAGIPQIYAATSESFVAQMLNLDLLGAIAFDKGCYTGQEVIARAHYRGRVKRRLQRWFHSGHGLVPGAAARSADGRHLSVVRVAPGAAGGQEILAVGPFVNETAALADVEPGNAPVVEPRPLPYALPE
ncbi:MAG: folate-binding protein YgfZ [Steroidobacteraceae bacterium]|nr:folate-binding protein YgfZ [Steroidobacteraceae bacterium]